MAERNPSRPWTESEDLFLIDAVQRHGEQDNWKKVATHVPGRTNKACRKRWLHSLSPSIKKSAWTTAEDELLLSLYTIHGTKWSAIAREIPGRTDDACSKRYREALDPALKKDEWTSDEDKRLMELFHEIGGKWGQVGQELQRSGLACRNRHRLLLKRQTKLSYEALADEGPFTFSRTIDSLDWPLIDPSQLAEAYPSLPDKEAHCSDIIFRSPTPDVFSGTPNAAPFRFLSSSLNTALPIGHRSLPAIPEDQESTSLLSNEAEHLLLNLSVQEEEMAKNDAPINFMAGTDLSQIFLGVHFDDNGVFQYPGSANASPVGVVPQLETYTWSSSSITEPISSPTSVHGHLATDTIPSTLSTPYDFPLSLSGTSSPNVSSPIDLAANELQLNFREASPQRRSPRTKRRKGNNTGISEKPLRLSSSLALTTDPSIRPYACGRESCWPSQASFSSFCFPTSGELLDHTKSFHAGDSNNIGSKPYRCALSGCGKSWKTLNGLQYHLQISTAHYRTALSSTFSQGGETSQETASASDLDNEAADSTDDTHPFTCSHPHCFRVYRHPSGLRYHLKHGHPQEQPAQLSTVPPAIARDFPSKTRRMRRKIP